ncbi:hypothetical protein Ddc_19131 [Ditylenchus destructor]|nr:hypothetical protein Ddc_19131 [Ditylenchus destructor]
MTPIRLRARPNQPIKIRPLQALVTSTTSDCTLPTETVIRNEALLEVRINNRTVLPLMVSAGPQDSFEVTPEQWKQFSPSLSKTDDLQITIAPARTLNESSRRLIECEGIKADVTLAIDVFRSPSFHLSSATTGN